MKKETQAVIKALNMYGRVPKIWELLEEIERLNNIIKEFENKDYDIAQERADFLLEIKKLNNIINELEKWIKENNLGKYRTENVVNTDELLDKLQELLRSDKE